MKVGLVGFPGSGKTTVFNALTGLSAETGFAAARGRTNLGTVKVPDERVLALAELYHPRKTILAEITFCDVAAAAAGSIGQSLDEQTLRAMREVDALCQVVRGFRGTAGDPPDPLAEAKGLEDEMNLADLILIEKRLERLAEGAEQDRRTRAAHHPEDRPGGRHAPAPGRRHRRGGLDHPGRLPFSHPEAPAPGPQRARGGGSQPGAGSPGRVRP